MILLCLPCARQDHSSCERYIFLGDACGNVITADCECTCPLEVEDFDCKPSLYVVDGGRK